jgi:allophanate hydrolase
MTTTDSLDITTVLDAYRSGRSTPGELIAQLLEKSRVDPHHVWITRLSRDQVMAYVGALDPAAMDRLPLYGVPFVIKDNIDLAGVPTTAGCPDFAYTPTHSATAVQKLLDAGAIPLGKTNLDQFATGLVGVRSPYGACRNSFDADYISGGSSAGSAVAVATGLASFSFGTDTAGSGRVPAAFNNIIGLKPSKGRLSTAGVVPACRSLDCLSIFALTADDAATVLQVAEGLDARDPFSRAAENHGLAGLRVGVPRPDQLQFFGDAEYARLFGLAVRELGTLGAMVKEIDFSAFLAAARLLYEGPWIAERYAAVGSFIEAHPDATHPVTRHIIEGGKQPNAVAAFVAAYRLKELERLARSAWSELDLLCTPTAGTIYTIAEVEADPIRLNSNLGYYTNFMNLLDLCGVAVPTGFRSDGMPFGVTLIGPRGTDHALLELAGRLHRAAVSTTGCTGSSIPPAGVTPARVWAGYATLAVCGAHMRGLPLNHQLRDRGGYFVAAAHTAPHYRLFALPGGSPRRPGLIRVADGGAAIGLEVWALPSEHVGSFLAGIPAPLGLGTIELDSGVRVTGFLCEAYATAGAQDVSQHGGWREYLKAAAA